MRKTPRRWQKEGFIPFRLEILTPVFIGSGTELSPLEYIIRQEQGTYRLHIIDLQSWLLQHAGEAQIQETVASGDIGRIRRMLEERVEVEYFSVDTLRIDDASLAEELKQAYSAKQPQRQGRQAVPAGKGKTGIIDAALRNPMNRCPYIPGSSLKGSMSTPVINWLDRKMIRNGEGSLKDARSRYQSQMTKMFGSIGEHAMQALKVSDVIAPLSGCAIVRAREISRNSAKKGTPKFPCEAIMPAHDGLWGRLMMDCSSDKTAITLPDGSLLDLSELVHRGNEFYRSRFAREMSTFYQLGHFSEVYQSIQGIAERIQHLDGNTLLLRVGHYSHIESVTVDNNQPVTRKTPDGKQLPYGTTRTLANGKYPFGWILLHFCGMEEYQQGIQEAEQKQKELEEQRFAQLLDLRRQARIKAEQEISARQQREERRLQEVQQALEEQRRREELEQRLAQLSPEEAMMARLQEEPNEALSMELYAAMKAWTPELKQKAATILKECWEQMGKWSGKQSKKQQEKIKEVKALLGL